MIDKSPAPSFLDGPNGRLAYLRSEGRAASPGLVWLGGYASDMHGTKAEALAQHAAQRGLAYLRFDYSGHGDSEGAFEDGTIGRWAEDAGHALARLTSGPQILVGSSMGGWIAGLLARAMPERVAALVLIAPAADFTTDLIPHQWPENHWQTLQRDGILRLPSGYDDSEMIYTRALFDDGARHRLLTMPLPFSGPVRILTGMKDDVVPWQHVTRYACHIGSDDVVLTMVKDGDHRMSSPADLARLFSLIDELTHGR